MLNLSIALLTLALQINPANICKLQKGSVNLTYKSPNDACATLTHAHAGAINPFATDIFSQQAIKTVQQLLNLNILKRKVESDYAT